MSIEGFEASLKAEGITHARGGTYMVMEGPQFSTLAESQLYRSWGAKVIGMTNMPEAKLAREAEISYCTIAMVTDYDCWHEEHGSVDVAKVIEVLKANSGNATQYGAEIEGQCCFIIHEGTFAQARRLDGVPFTRGDGTRIKAKNLPGSEGAFIGQRWLGDTQHVLLVEGVIGLMEALAAFALVNMTESWSILAATSASSRFARDPALLARLTGRHVRIVPDADEAGMNAAASWLADLEAAGARADAVALPDGFKDLGEIIAARESHLETLNEIFQ